MKQALVAVLILLGFTIIIVGGAVPLAGYIFVPLLAIDGFGILYLLFHNGGAPSKFSKRKKK